MSPNITHDPIRLALEAGDRLQPVLELLADVGVDVSADTALRWIRSGMPATRAGGRWRSCRQVVVDWLVAQREPGVRS